MELVQLFPSYQPPHHPTSAVKTGEIDLRVGQPRGPLAGRFGGFLKVLSSLPGTRGGGGHTVLTARQEPRSPGVPGSRPGGGRQCFPSEKGKETEKAQPSGHTIPSPLCLSLSDVFKEFFPRSAFGETCNQSSIN